MIINDSILVENKKLNEVKSVPIGGGAKIYRRGDNYYINKGGSRKEISADQYWKLYNNRSSDGSDMDDKSNDPVSTKDQSKSLDTKIDTSNIDYDKFTDKIFSGYIEDSKKDDIKQSLDYINDKGSNSSSAVNTVLSNFNGGSTGMIHLDFDDYNDADVFDMNFKSKNDDNLQNVKNYLEDLVKSNKATYTEGRDYNIYSIKSENGTGDTDICIDRWGNDSNSRVKIYNYR